MAQTHKPGKPFSMETLSTQVQTVVLLLHSSEFKTTVLFMVCMGMKLASLPEERTGILRIPGHVRRKS
jgi:hypothetical protein